MFWLGVHDPSCSKSCALIKRTWKFKPNNVSFLCLKAYHWYRWIGTPTYSVCSRQKQHFFFKYKVLPPINHRQRARHVGLINGGATCYMNSILQQLYHTPGVTEVSQSWQSFFSFFLYFFFLIHWWTTTFKCVCYAKKLWSWICNYAHFSTNNQTRFHLYFPSEMIFSCKIHV